MSVFNTLLLASRIKPQPGGHDIYGTADPNATINLNINASRYSDVGTQYTVTADEYGNWGWDVPSGVTLTTLRYLLGTQYNNNPHIKTVYFSTNLDTSSLVSIDHLFSKSQVSSYDQGSQLTAVYGLSNIINVSDNIEFLLSGCSSLTTIDDMDLWNFSAKTDLTGIFMNCSSLPINTTYAQEISDIFSTIDSATSLSYFFYGTELNNETQEGLVFSDPTPNILDLSYMFAYTNITRFCSSDCDYTMLGQDYRSTIPTDQATNLSGMFQGCNIGDSTTHMDPIMLCTGDCTNMSHMFENCNFYSDLCIPEKNSTNAYNTDNVTNISYLFKNTTGNFVAYRFLYGCDLYNVLNASHLFEDSSIFKVGNGALSSYVATELSNVTDCSYMYRRSTPDAYDSSGSIYPYMPATTQNMSHMFEGTNIASLQNLNVSVVTDMSYAFAHCRSINWIHAENFDVSNVVDFSYAFYDCTSIWTTTDYFTNWDTSAGENFECMFSGCTALGDPNGSAALCLDGISHFDMSNAENVSEMFMDCPLYELKTDSGGFISNPMTYIQDWDLSSCKYFSSMFENCEGLEVAYLQRWNVQNIDPAGGTAIDRMFAGCTSLKAVYLNNWDLTNLTNNNVWAWSDFLPNNSGLEVYYSTGLITSDFENNFTPNIMFSDVLIDGSSFVWDKQVYLNIDGVTFNVEADANGYWAIHDDGSVLAPGYVAHNLYGMLNNQVTNNNYVYVVSIKGLDINDVTEMSNMFDGNSGIAQIYFGYGDTSKVTSMAGMMRGTSQVSTFSGPRSTVSVTNMSEIFSNSAVSSLDLSSWYTPRLTNLSSAFGQTWIITNLVVPNFYDGRLTSVGLSNAFPNRSNCYIYYDDYPTATTRNLFHISIWTQYQP